MHIQLEDIVYLVLMLFIGSAGLVIVAILLNFQKRRQQASIPIQPRDTSPPKSDTRLKNKAYIDYNK